MAWVKRWSDAAGWFALALGLTTGVSCGGSTSTAKPAETSGVEPLPPATIGDAEVRSKVFMSQPYTIDRKYKSMKGPYSTEEIFLIDSKEPELLWVVGYDALVVGAEDDAELSQEYMCHANLDFDPGRYYQDFQSNASMSGRMFTLSQGMQNVQFPDGFGMPIMSDVPLSVMTQVLNLNDEDPDLNVRHKVTLRYVRDRDIKGTIRPLFQAGAQGLKSLDSQPAQYGMSSFEEDEHGPGCGLGMAAVEGSEYVDDHKQRFTGHWVVPPGKDVNRTLATKYLQLQFDTTVHYIAVHLHPYAESLELFDITAGKTVFKSHVRSLEGKIGIEHIEHFESAEGIPIYTDHEYEIISVYNNTTDADVDSMAVMYMYLHDKNFRKPIAKSKGGAASAQKQSAAGIELSAKKQ